MNDRKFFDAAARLRTAWDDRARLAWLPWPVGALVLFAIAKHAFTWMLA